MERYFQFLDVKSGYVLNLSVHLNSWPIICNDLQSVWDRIAEKTGPDRMQGIMLSIYNCIRLVWPYGADFRLVSDNWWPWMTLNGSMTVSLVAELLVSYLELGRPSDASDVSVNNNSCWNHAVLNEPVTSACLSVCLSVCPHSTETGVTRYVLNQTTEVIKLRWNPLTLRVETVEFKVNVNLRAFVANPPTADEKRQDKTRREHGTRSAHRASNHQLRPRIGWVDLVTSSGDLTGAVWRHCEHVVSLDRNNAYF